jgi:hypothetical protein
VAESKLTASLQRRMHDLGERKETLTNEEHSELLALVEFAEERTLEKLRAMLALKRLEHAAPKLFENT